MQVLTPIDSPIRQTHALELVFILYTLLVQANRIFGASGLDNITGRPGCTYAKPGKGQPSTIYC